MDEKQVCLFYEEMKRAFVKPDSDWTDKGTIFRTLLESFFKCLTSDLDKTASLNDRINHHYDSHATEEEFRFRAHRIRKKTNAVVHNSISIGNKGVSRASLSRKDIRDIYEDLVLVIYGATRQFPDQETFLLLGYEPEGYLNDLNEQQKDAVLCPSSIVFVNAGPGTGKTTLLVSKLIHFVKSQAHNKVVALSFTNTAANQLGDKFQEQAFRHIKDSNYEFLNGTIHSFCIRKLRKYHLLKNRPFNYLIIGDEDLFELVHEIHNRINNQYTVEEIIEFLKNGRAMWPEPVAKAIEDIKKEYKLISLNDILTMFLDTLYSDADFASWILQSTDLIVIDEAQDLTENNFKIFDRMLELKPSLNLFLVGDPRQNIFEFNGGSYSHLEDFLKRHQDKVGRRYLSLSYRCPRQVLDFVNSFEFTDCDNIHLTSDISGALVASEFPTPEAESEGIANAIDALDMDECAVLSPNIKGLAPLITELNRRRIPFIVFGGRRHLKAPIRILNNLLKVLWNNDERSIRSIGRDFGVDVKTQPVDAFRHFSPKELFYSSPFGRKLRTINNEYTKQEWSLPSLINTLIDRLFPSGIKEDAPAMKDLDNLISLASSYKTIKEYLDAFVLDKDRFIAFYEKDFQESVTPTDDGYLTLSTIHSAKGLQWKHVFIVGLYELNFPGIEKYKNKNTQKQEAYLNTKKKELYVACTRAAGDLSFSFPASVNNQPQKASRLLAGIPISRIEPV